MNEEKILLRYIRIEPVNVKKMSLAMARIISHKNLRPELNPRFQDEGYMIDDSIWMTEEEFRAAPYYPAEKREEHD